MEKIQKVIAAKKIKKIVYILVPTLLVGWVLFRFAIIASENSRHVFNASRAALQSGVPVDVVHVKKQPGTLYEPLVVKNNRAYVTSNRVAKLRSGQKIGQGKILSVSSGVDFDTGMHIVSTTGVADGLQYAEYTASGYFIPLYAISDGAVYVVRDGVAERRTVNVVHQDSENAYVTSGLSDGDIVILSSVKSGEKVKVSE